MNEKQKQIQEARDTMCIVYGIAYAKILELQDELKQAGIRANIAVGGLQIYANFQDETVQLLQCLTVLHLTYS